MNIFWMIIGMNIGIGICYIAQIKGYKINPLNPDLFERVYHDREKI